MSRATLLGAALLAAVLIPTAAFAIDFGGARLVSVVPVDGGCVYGPSGPFVQAWDVEPGRTYTLTITGVTECAAGGTAPTLGVRVNSTDAGNTDLVATLVEPGTYRFDFTLPGWATCTMPIFYCTSPGQSNTGLFVRRADGQLFQAHLRASTFDPGCTNPHEVFGPSCGALPNAARSWGLLKIRYR